MTNNLTLLTGDALKLDIKTETIDLIITHPPYLGVDVIRYGGDASDQINVTQDKKKMLKLLLKATKEMYRVLKPNGQLWIAIGAIDTIEIEYISSVISNTKFIYLDRIIQNAYVETDLSERIPKHTMIVWYHLSKSENVFFNPFSIKKWNNPVWNLPINNIEDPIDKELSKSHHVFDTMSKELVVRLISMFSKKDHTILDPFGGSALVAVTAAELGRLGVSNDISDDQTKVAEKRAKMSLKTK
jgi:DNA modification methylase